MQPALATIRDTIKRIGGLLASIPHDALPSLDALAPLPEADQAFAVDALMHASYMDRAFAAKDYEHFLHHLEVACLVAQRFIASTGIGAGEKDVVATRLALLAAIERRAALFCSWEKVR